MTEIAEILRRIMNIIERVRDMPELSSAAQIAFGALLVFGILNCVLGYRLLRFWLLLFGFGIGAALGGAGAYMADVADKTMYLIVMLIVGILLAVVAFYIYKVGIFLLGAGLGSTISIYVLHPTTSFVFFLCLLVGVGLGSLAMKWAKEVIITGTSLLGGMLAGVSLARLGGLSELPYGIAMSVAFVILGMLIQFATNRSKEQEDEEGDDPEKKLNEQKNRQ